MTDPSLISFFYSDGTYSSANLNYKNVLGINDLSISNSISFEDSPFLGAKSIFSLPNSACQFNISFNRSFICTDPLLNYTGSYPIEKSYLSCIGDNKRIVFCNLYLTNYSVGFSVGELPIINTKFISYSNLNYHNYTPFGADLLSTEIINSSIDVPKLGGISIVGTCSNEITNLHNIFSFDYSLEIKREPYYSIGSCFPNVQTIFPIIINFSVNSKIYDKTISNNTWPKYQMAPNLKYYNFDISVVGSTQSTYFPIRNATLVSSEIQYQSTNSPEIKRNFIGYYGI